MKTISFFFAAILLLTLYSCQRDDRPENEAEDEQVNTDKNTPLKLIEYLVGEWEMVGSPKGREGAEAGSVPGERLTFTSEARYIIREGDQKTDSGAYRMNEQLNNLYLESEATKQPVEYEIELDTDTMTLTPNEGGATYTYRRRMGPASIPPDKTQDAPGTD